MVMAMLYWVIMESRDAKRFIVMGVKNHLDQSQSDAVYYGLRLRSMPSYDAGSDGSNTGVIAENFILSMLCHQVYP